MENLMMCQIKWGHHASIAPTISLTQTLSLPHHYFPLFYFIHFLPRYFHLSPSPSPSRSPHSPSSSSSGRYTHCLLHSSTVADPFFLASFPPFSPILRWTSPIVKFPSIIAFLLLHSASFALSYSLRPPNYAVS